MPIAGPGDRDLLTLESKGDALARQDLTDARKGAAQTWECREGDLVVIAGGGGTQDGVRAIAPECAQRIGTWNCFGVQFYFDFRSVRQMSQIGDQPVGDIDGCAGQTGKACTKGNRRLRHLIPLGQIIALRVAELMYFPLEDGEPSGAVADRARDIDRVARFRAAALDHFALGHKTESRYGNTQRALGGGCVAAKKRDAEFALVFGKPGGEIRQPFLTHRRQREIEQVIFRRGAFGREIGEIHPQGFFCHRGRGIVRKKIGIRGDLICGDHQIEAGARWNKRRVILQPQRAGIFRERREIAGDEAGLIHPLQKSNSPSGTGKPNSLARFRRAMRSSAALTKPGSSPAKKSWAMPTYSSITTLAGTSRLATSSRPAALRIARRMESTRANVQVSLRQAAMALSISAWCAGTPSRMLLKRSWSVGVSPKRWAINSSATSSAPPPASSI